MEYSICRTPIKYHSTVIMFLIFSFKMSSRCVNSDRDIQILHFIKELERDKIKNECFSLAAKCPL